MNQHKTASRRLDAAQCPYLKVANPEKGYDCGLCKDGEACELSAYKSRGFAKCLTFQYRHLFIGYKMVVKT